MRLKVNDVRVLVGLAGIALGSTTQAEFQHAYFFGASTEITTQGLASWDSNSGTYQLTIGGDSSGAMWHNERQQVDGGFVTTFQFRIEPGTITGDGFALVIHDDPAGTAARGGGGSNIGYGPGITDSMGSFASITNGIAVEFDTFGFGGEFNVPHVSIQAMNESGECDNADGYSLAHAELLPLGIDILDGRSHVATVQYIPETQSDPARLEVWVEDVLVCSAEVNLEFVPVDPLNSVDAPVFNNDPEHSDYGSAVVGFTAGTGLADSTHMIEAWAFNGDTGDCQGPYWWLAGTGSGCGVPNGPCSMGMEVAVQGTRPMVYEWYRNGAIITDDEGGRLVGIDARHLEINPATSADAAYYRAEFSNGCGAGTFGDVFIVPHIYCNDIDFNNDGLFPDTADVDDFLSVFSGGPCIGAGYTCDPIDFNNDGLFPDTADIDSFLNVFSGGECIR